MKNGTAQTFAEVAEDFNFSARRFLDTYSTIDLLLAKYSALQTFRLTEREEKEQLAAALFDMCENALKVHAVEGKFGGLGEYFVNAADQLMAVLAEPDNALLLPKRAPAALGDLALIFIQKAERVSEADFDTWTGYKDYRDAINKLAPATLKYAKKIKAVADRQVDSDLSTTKKLTVRRPLVLKAKGGDGGPAG